MVLKSDIAVEKRRKCYQTLIGKLYSKSNVNFQAFTSTMRKAWKSDRVECALIEPELFSFTFSSIAE